MTYLHGLNVAEAARRIAEGSVSPVALVDACLDRIRRHDGAIAAWVHIDEAAARAAARERAAEAKAGRLRGPLHGVPVAIKDVIDVAGMPTTCGAASFAHRHPTEDAAAVARLRAAGAVILGKVATTEFAYFEPAPTRNPWHLDHTPGGSSSGSAAAVAARMVPAALGTQTVGSVLRPAAYCGVVGFKGSHGAVPVDGLCPLAPSLDHVGVFARATADVRLLFAVLTARSPVPGHAPPPRLLVPRELLARARPEVATQLSAAAERLARAGATVAEAALPASFPAIHDAVRAVLEGEFAAGQEESYRLHADLYRPRTRQLIETGLAQRTARYLAAQRLRAQFARDMAPLLDSGVLLTPTAPQTAPKGLQSTGDPWFCAPWSAIGVPAVSLPTGIGAEGLPHAIQLVGRGGGDGDLLAAAEWCEARFGFDSAPAFD
jgi:Asp-tRNA(Asn)/Glu-tRNA(Gln) amidotransferase A subunit family amidase